MASVNDPAEGHHSANARRRRLAEEYLRRHHEVEGWLDETAARVTDHLLQTQITRSVTGNVMEIGVHHGRYFLVLANGLVDGEAALAVDLFKDQHLNVSASGHGDWAVFVGNVRRFAPLTHVEVVQADSATMEEAFIAAKQGMRFVSIDGGHDRATTCADLWLAERLAVAGAIIALDDIYRPDWSGVTAGLSRYFDEGGGLHPFAFIPNKLLLSTDTAWAEAYRAELRRSFPA